MAQLLPQERLHELYQPQHTYADAAATSRIDRVYTNQHVVEQLDRHIFVAPLEFTRLSQHRPLAFGRVGRLPGAKRVQNIAAEIINDERWPMTVALELQ